MAKKDPPLRFYLDVGMPRVAEYLRSQGFDTATAEHGRGAAAHDHQHLQQAKDEFRIFVTKDIERVRREAEAHRLTNSPGIVGVHSSNTAQDEIIEAMQSVLWLSRRWKHFYERHGLSRTNN